MKRKHDCSIEKNGHSKYSNFLLSDKKKKFLEMNLSSFMINIINHLIADDVFLYSGFLEHSQANISRALIGAAIIHNNDLAKSLINDYYVTIEDALYGAMLGDNIELFNNICQNYEININWIAEKAAYYNMIKLLNFILSNKDLTTYNYDTFLDNPNFLTKNLTDKSTQFIDSVLKGALENNNFKLLKYFLINIGSYFFKQNKKLNYSNDFLLNILKNDFANNLSAVTIKNFKECFRNHPFQIVKIFGCLKDNLLIRLYSEVFDLSQINTNQVARVTSYLNSPNFNHNSHSTIADAYVLDCEKEAMKNNQSTALRFFASAFYNVNSFSIIELNNATKLITIPNEILYKIGTFLNPQSDIEKTYPRYSVNICAKIMQLWQTKLFNFKNEEISI